MMLGRGRRGRLLFGGVGTAFHGMIVSREDSALWKKDTHAQLKHCVDANW